MKKILIYLTITLLLVSSAYANPFMTIGMKSLSFVNPAIGEAVNYAICAATIATCISSKITGHLTGELTNEVIKKLPKEAVKAITTYNQISGYIREGAQITRDLKVNNQGKVEDGRLDLANSKNLANVGNIISPKFKAEDIKVKGIILEKNKDKSTFQFQSGKNGEVTIKDRKFENIDKGNIILDKDGNIQSADFFTNQKGSTYKLGNAEVNVPPNTHLKYNSNSNYITIEVTGSQNIKPPTFTKSKSNTRVEFYVPEYLEKGLGVSNGVILNQGYIVYEGDKIFIPKETKAIINNVNINSKNSNVFLDFRGQKLQSSQNYVSFDIQNKKLIIHANQEGVQKIEFNEGNPFLNVDSNFRDIAEIDNLKNVEIGIVNRKDQGFIPSVDVTNINKQAKYTITSGKIELSYINGEIRTKISPLSFNHEKEPNTVAMGLKFTDEKGNSLLGNKESPKKIIISSDNEYSTTDISKELGQSNIKPESMVSERFSANYETCPICFPPTDVRIVGYNNQDYNNILTPRETRAVYREINSYFTGAQKSAIKRIVIYSDLDYLKLEQEEIRAGIPAKNRKYSSEAFSEDQVIHIKQSTIGFNGALTHEAAHCLKEISKKAEAESKDFIPRIKRKIFGGEKVVGVETEIAEIQETSKIPYWSEVKTTTEGYKWERSSDKTFTGAIYGCATAYGCTSVTEDVAELTRVVNTKPENYKQLIDPHSEYYKKLDNTFVGGITSNKWARVYRQKLDILYRAGFIKEEAYKAITSK